MAQKTATYSAGVTAGTYTNADVTVSTQGVVTAIANGSAGSLTLAGDVTGPAGTNLISNVASNPLQVTYVALIAQPTLQERQQLTTSLRPQNDGGTNLFYKFERTGRFTYLDFTSAPRLFDQFVIPAGYLADDWTALVEIKMVGSISAADGGGTFMLARHQSFKNLSGVLSLEGVGSTQLNDFTGGLNPSAVTFQTTNAPQSIDFYLQTPANVFNKGVRFWYTVLIT